MTRNRPLALLFAVAGTISAWATERTVTSSADDGSLGTLRHTVVSLSQDGDRVLFDPGVTAITLSGTQIPISNAVSIVGNGVSISGNGNSRVFYIYAGPTDNVILSGLVVTNGYSTGYGGGIYADRCGTLTLTNCIVTKCTSTSVGGGVCTEEELIAADCSFLGNQAVEGGGILHLSTAEPLTVRGGRFVGNKATTGTGSTYRGGGAIKAGYWDASILTIEGGTVFSNNYCNTHQGAGVLVGGKYTSTFRDALFVDNETKGIGTAAGAGGGVWVGSAQTTLIENCTFLRNRAGNSGGAISQNGGTVMLIGCSIRENFSTNTLSAGGGGGVWSRDGSMVVSNCHFFANRETAGATGGGAIATYGGAARTLRCVNTLFEGNTSFSGGGAVMGGVRTELDGCTFRTNAVLGTGKDGGAFWLGGQTGVVVNCTFSGNTAVDDGGAICAEQTYAVPNYRQARLWVYNSTITGNRGDCGGIILNENVALGGEVRLFSTIVAGNVDTVGTDSGQTNDLHGQFDELDYCLVQESPASYTLLDGAPVGNLPVGTDPLLAPLADNGGPALPDDKALLTCALLPGSPALNAGANPLALALDQRGPGFLREYPASSPDIGAFEFAPGMLPFTGTLLMVQ